MVRPSSGKYILFKLVRFTGPPSTRSVVLSTSRGISTPAGCVIATLFAERELSAGEAGAALRGVATTLRLDAVFALALDFTLVR